jgi:hypothetical protein
LADSPFIVLPNFDSFVLLTYQLGIETAKKSPIRTHEAILNSFLRAISSWTYIGPKEKLKP